MKAKQALDLLFKDYTFDTALYKKLVYNNIEFITSDSDHKHLFGSKIVGCFYLKYTIYDKNIFYNNVFGLSYDDVAPAIDTISSINKSYKIARDDITICFQFAYIYLSSSSIQYIANYAINDGKDVGFIGEVETITLQVFHAVNDDVS